MINLSQDMDDRAREKALSSLKDVEKQFRKIGLDISADTTNDLIAELEKPKGRQNFQWLYDQAESITKLCYKELRGRAFFYLSPDRAKFWPTIEKPHAFGEKVGASFPSAYFDIFNAGVCLATTMSTAAVFHLMRVLEIGLTALGKEFNVSLAHTNWQPAILEIEKKIREMPADPRWKVLPDCKEQQEFYAQAASHFGVLKDAWRNHTMHVRGRYGDGEAEQIYNAVKAFMEKLAERLHE
jgi:hypothetical protein